MWNVCECGFLAVVDAVLCVVVFFFFFQAEDGIRDYKVTGVQTCALPILQASPSFATSQRQMPLSPRSPGAMGAMPVSPRFSMTQQPLEDIYTVQI